MIRPLTIATCLMACGSGLYLYQSKHEVQLLDRTIERTVHDTAALREQSRLLAAEWTMLTNPERLRQFSDTYLILKTISPQQFSSLADLDGRLPPPRSEEPENDPAEPQQTPEASASVPAVAGMPSGRMIPSVTVMPSGAVTPAAAITPPVAAPDPVAAADAAPTEDVHLPVPPVPKAPRPAGVTVVTRPAETRSPDRPPVQHTLAAESQPHPAESHPAETRPSEPRVSEPHAGRLADTRPDARVPAAPPLPRLTVARPVPAVAGPANGPPAVVPARQPIVAGTPPNGGSLLGMARGSSPSSPRPTPVNATYNPN